MKIFDKNIDPKKRNIPTDASQKEQVIEIKERSSELIQDKQQDYLDKTQKAQYADPIEATSNPVSNVFNRIIPDTAAILGGDKHIDGQAPAEDLNDIHRPWLGEVGQGIMRGVGQTISSNGDLINMVGSALPGVTMLEGNIIGNKLNAWGDDIENEHMTFLKKKLQGQEITWDSFADKNFWSANVSEMIPLALEFLATGMAAGAVTQGAAKIFARKALGGLARKAGTQTTVGAVEGLAGLGEMSIDVLGSGKGVVGALLKNVKGTAELTQLGADSARFVGAGLANNLMAGAMNGMQLHKQMQEENKRQIAEGKEPLYTEDEMAEAATGTVKNNMAYLPIDVLSWGVTYGKALEKGYASITRNMIKSEAQISLQAAGGFKEATFGIFKGLAKAGGHALAEGIEETYQETFENWAAAKAKEKVVGVDPEKGPVPDFFDYYKSKDNLATKVLSFAMGGMMGGVTNIKSVFEKNSSNALNYMNRNDVLRASIDANNKEGQQWKEFHIHNQMLDLHNEGKEELFDGFMTSLLSKGTVTEDQVVEYKNIFDSVGEDFAEAKQLNIAGKEALMRNTVASKFLKKSIENDKTILTEKIKEIETTFPESSERTKMIQKLQDNYNESARTKAHLITMHEQNRLNLISGKLANPVNIQFIVSKNGTERIMMPDFMTELGFKEALDNGGIFAGLSEEQYQNYIEKSDDEIYADAKAANDKAYSALSAKQKKEFKGWFDTASIEDVKEEEIKNDINSEQTAQEVEKMQAEYDDILAGKDPQMSDEDFNASEPGIKASELKSKIDQASKSIPPPAAPENYNIVDRESDDKFSNRNVDGENEFETEQVEAPEDTVKRKTIKENEADAVEEAKKETADKIEKQLATEKEVKLLKEKRDQTEEGSEERKAIDDRLAEIDTTENEDVISDYVEPNSKPNADGKYPGFDSKGNEKLFSSKKLADSSIERYNKKKGDGKSSIVGKFFSRFGKKKNVSNEVNQEEQNQILKEKAIGQNKAQTQARQNIIQIVYEHVQRNQMNNPTVPVSVNKLDNYLNSSIAKFKYGPTTVQKQIVLNRNLKARGIDIDVIYANNLFDAVGTEAVGYAIASTIFIDDKVQDQAPVFMHEMLHVLYRTTKDNPETKAVIDRAWNNRKLVDVVKENYSDGIIYDFTQEDGTVVRMSLIDALINEGLSYNDAINIFEGAQANNDYAGLISSLGNPTESDREFQDNINEELFTHILEGKAAKKYNEFFEQKEEFGNRKVSSGWLSWLRDKSVTYESENNDVITALNNGKSVGKEDLFDHILQNFTDNLKSKPGNTGTTRGFFSKVSKQRAEVNAQLATITKEKIAQQNSYDPAEAAKRDRQSFKDKIWSKIRQAIKVDATTGGLTEAQTQLAIDNAATELENNMMEGGSFDDMEMLKQFQFRGATRILNNFTKSYNYVKRQRFFLNPNNKASDFNNDMLVDRDELISEMFNLAFSTKGNASEFIRQIENSDTDEIHMFNKYMDKMYPGQKIMYLNSMAYVMSNNQTISAIKNTVSNGRFTTENALSETERNKVESHMDYIAQADYQSLQAKINGRSSATVNSDYYDTFRNSYSNIEKGIQTAQDYFNILEFLSPYGIKISELYKGNNINIRGNTVSIKQLIDNFVKFSVAIEKDEKGRPKMKVEKLRPFIEAIVDSNRKFTSYSVVQNAEGNMEPSKITNNYLLSQINKMNDFLAQKNMPSFAAFKEKFAHITADGTKRTHENPILKNIYDNVKRGKSIPSITQYMGLKHLDYGKNSLYKNSTDFTQSIEDFLMFANPNRPNSPEYQHNMGAFADSPRKFMFSAKRLAFEDHFKVVGGNTPTLNLQGQRQLENAFKVYTELNKNLPSNKRQNLIESFDEFKSMFDKNVQSEIDLWNQYGKDLVEGKILASYFKDNKLTVDGKRKLTEYVFNTTVNGLALAEIFNPGVATGDITKRNKGNSSPVMTFGNKNLRHEAIPIDDSKIETQTNSGMYMTERTAKKIIAAGQGVFDMNNGLKLLNYHVEEENPNFKGRAAYFKGYTTIISEETLKTEPALRGIYEMLTQREERYDNYFEKNNKGQYPSEDLLDGTDNHLVYAVPYSAIKSDLFTAQQKETLKDFTYDNLENGFEENNNKITGKISDETMYEKMHKVLDDFYYGADGKFMGLQSDNFGPQQIMDKLSTESPTPVQFISGVIVNGETTGNLELAEDIQKLIRADMDSNFNEVVKELNDMNPGDYKNFILKNLDLENMDQSQRFIIESNLTNLSHPAVADFVMNTLANRLKTAANKLKTEGAISQQKPDYFYRHANDYTVAGSSSLRGYSNNDRVNDDGSVGSNVLEIVLPKNLIGKVQPRTWLAIDSKETLDLLSKNSKLAAEYNKADEAGKLEVIKTLALNESLYRHGRFDVKNSFGYKSTDNIGQFEKNGKTFGYYVRGENVIASRIPSHGPASTGVFEAVDFLSSDGNQTIVSHEFSDIAGADYDGDALFIQHKSKATPNFNKALDKTVALWTSPGMHDQIRAKMEFESKVKKIIADNPKTTEKSLPFSPQYNREAYNNTMISKRNIGIVFNTHRIANYLAAYNVGLKVPIIFNGKEINNFQDDKVGIESRNNNSAMLANIILDNAKWHFADALGLNDQTINQFSLLINMGVSLEDVNKIMNSDAVKVWNKYKKNNESPYLTKRKKSDINNLVAAELNIQKPTATNSSYNINTSDLNSSTQKMNIISLMNHLENVNSEILKVSKIMAGHKGIENNPFILERQLKDFNEVVYGTGQNAMLTIPESFRNNPDIKAYHDNAEKILGIMEKASKIFRKSTSELITKLNEGLGWDGMTEDTLERASDLIKRFTNSRITGVNNLSSDEKTVIKKQLFNELISYRKSLLDARDENGVSALEKSILFQRALNLRGPYATRKGGDMNYDRAYVSANPRFFNESLVEEERAAAQREFEELPQSIKDGMIVLDMMTNGLTGPLSLVNVFDDSLNFDLSYRAYEDDRNKNKDINAGVMQELENIIVTNEFNHPDGKVLKITSPETVTADNILNVISKQQRGLYNSMMKGKPAYFQLNGQAYYYSGASKNDLGEIKSRFRGFTENDPNSGNKDRLVNSRIQPYTLANGDMNLNAISIADKTTGNPLKTMPSFNNDGKADHIIEANILQAEKKKLDGKASIVKPKLDYYNYTDVNPLSREEFDRVMGYHKAVSEEQREGLYYTYTQEKAIANTMFQNELSLDTIKKMTDAKLNEWYDIMSKKERYAYSIITTPLILEKANRDSALQSKLTGKFEDGNDIGLIKSWLDSNNISSNHPATQAVVRQINQGYKNFVRERAKYIKKINTVTDALYQEKFNLSENKLIRFAQRVYQSLLANRNDVYQKLYGNLVETNWIKLPNGKTRKEFKFRDQEAIEKDYRQNNISKAEYDFYKTFRETTEDLKQYDPNSNTRRDYIPHTSMDTMEMFSTRGVLGLMVNSKGMDSAMNDVKIYMPGTRELISFNDIKNNYNAFALEYGNSAKFIKEFRDAKKKAKSLLEQGINEDGSRIEFSHMQNATIADMSPMSRFSSSRSEKAEQMPSMDLNKALVDYVHASLFTNGNAGFDGFKSMMPLIDGVMAYNDKNGYKNAFNYTKEVIKEGFIMKKDQDLFGPTTDKVINGFVRGNLLYALGYKGLIVGKGIYAIGNVIVGKYMNIKREGGKAWIIGEQRYWGTDQGYGVEAVERRRRAKNILTNLGFLELDIYDDVSIEKKTGLDGIFTGLALMPMSVTEDWIQKTHMLGMLTDEEFDRFDSNGNYKTGAERISDDRLLQLEERVKQSHGKGFTPTDQSRLQKYSLGRMFLQFSRHIPSQINERFAKEDIDVYGNKYVGSLRQMYSTATTIFDNGMSPEKFKAYYKTLDSHQKEALDAAMRGMAMMTLFAFVREVSTPGDNTSANSLASGAIKDNNLELNPDVVTFKMIPPAVRTSLAITNGIFTSDDKQMP